MMVFFSMQWSLVKSERLRRQHGKRRRPRPINRGRRLLGPAVLRTCPFASPRNQVRACLGPGGYCRHSGYGGTQTCLPAAHGAAPPVARYGLVATLTAQDPREGPSLARRVTTRP